jgi:hypothetical protein
MELTDKRKKLLEKAQQYRRVPGHGPDFIEMSIEELEKYVRVAESMFKLAFDKNS